MRIALLCRNPDLYSHRRLVEAGDARGHEVTPINHLRCAINIAARKPEIWWSPPAAPGAPPGSVVRSERLSNYDAVIPRIGASVTFFGAAVVRQFEMMGVWTLNESVAITRSRDKLRSLQLLSRKGIGLPRTVFAHRSVDPKEIIAQAGGAPVVIKLLEGTQGIGVMLAETASSAESILQAFGGLRANILVQEFVEEARGEDIRCLVVGEKVVAAMMRKGREGDFRSNLHRGGTALAVKISPEERATAVQAAKIMGLNLAGVDMLRSKNGPVVMEVNSSPGLEGVERATGKDVAGAVIDFVVKTAKPGATRTKGRG